jgi:PPK2 family polyphosphate:nucleotide phosphotransferase
MISEEQLINIKKLLVKPGKRIKLRHYETGYRGEVLNKKDAEQLLQSSIKQLALIQDELYAHNRYSVLIIFQAMDAAGKDGAIKHVMSGFNPQGVKVYSFKAPTSTELDHHYLWRHELSLPAQGEIAIHNRSHYENVLVTRVHPEFILNEKLPGITTVADIDKEFWERRLKQIKRFERNLTENGMLILKFFLHVSKEAQKKRFLERIEDPSKNWKFSVSDLKERGYWDEYQKAYEEAISKTSTEQAPWYVIPADDKWYARLAIASVIHQHFKKLELGYPVVSPAQRAELEKAKAYLLDEPSFNKVKKKK